MIQVENYFAQVPEKLQNNQKRCEKELLDRRKINNACWRNIKKELLTFFHNKCAYCETPLALPESIDHYRPKKIYYWLAHEWTNFLPSCDYCQKAKADIFETENPHLEVPLLADGSLDYEKCKADGKHLLSENSPYLHPVLDDPNEHLDIILENFEKLGKKQGFIIPKTPKGEKSRDFYNLNRKNLILERRKIINEILDKIITEREFLKKNNVPESLLDRASIDLVMPKIIENSQNNKEYAFVWRKISVFFGN
ncbi:MAG: hypothetical protein EAZ97_14350 [Bacteroidetes bacterium]|nr:MAG: hypothetical protein EAZ97_14350 [Bacteroidota bacterium]